MSRPPPSGLPVGYPSVMCVPPLLLPPRCGVLHHPPTWLACSCCSADSSWPGSCPCPCPPLAPENRLALGGGEGSGSCMGAPEIDGAGAMVGSGRGRPWPSKNIWKARIKLGHVLGGTYVAHTGTGTHEVHMRVHRHGYTWGQYYTRGYTGTGTHEGTHDGTTREGTQARVHMGAHMSTTREGTQARVHMRAQPRMCTHIHKCTCNTQAYRTHNTHMHAHAYTHT